MVYIIAEVAGIHNGNKEYIIELIEKLKENTDAIKFQPYSYKTICRDEKNYEYYNLLKNVTQNFSLNDWTDIINLAASYKIDVWIDIHDLFSLQVFKNNKENIFGVKIPTGNILNLSIMDNFYIFESKKIIINFAGFDDNFINNFIRSYCFEKNNFIIQLGVQNYPTKIEDSNLNRLDQLKKFGFELSYADHLSYKHKLVFELSKYAYFCGAKYIEKHVCLKNDENLPDYYSSINIDNFIIFYKEMKFLDIILGKNNVKNKSINKYIEGLNTIPMLINSLNKNDIITSNQLIYKRSSTDKINLVNFNNYLPMKCLKYIDGNNILQINKNVGSINITAVIVVRFKSKRLPGKCIKKINGIESIIRCINNVKKIKYINNIVLATSSEKENNILIEIAKKENIKYVIGSENNLIDRYILAGEKTNAEHIVRITGDCPCLSYEIADLLINSHLQENKDMTIALPGTYAVGLASEIYSMNALKLLKDKLTINGQNMTEYLTLFMPFNPITFKTNIVKLPNIFSKYLQNKIITLDTQYDYDLINNIYKFNNVDNRAISYNEINEYFINNNIKNNERIVSLGDNKKLEKLIEKFNLYGNIDGKKFIKLKKNHYEHIKDIYNKK